MSFLDLEEKTAEQATAEAAELLPFRSRPILFLLSAQSVSCFVVWADVLRPIWHTRRSKTPMQGTLQQRSEASSLRPDG